MSTSTTPPPVARVYAYGSTRIVVEVDRPDVELVVAQLADGRLVAAWYDDRGRRLRRVEPARA